MNLRQAFLLGAVLASGMPCSSWAQPYPSKSIRMIIPAPAGGGVDTIGRAVGQKIAEALGQAVVADNRPGAGTMIGSELTAKAPPDGYTILMMTNSHVINGAFQKNLRYDVMNDFTEISLLAISPYLLVIHPSVPAHNVKDLLALAHKRPGELHFASAGAGSATHLAGELFKHMGKINIVHVPYKGGAPAVTDLLGGHVQILFNNLISVLALTKSGRLRALAVTSSQRLNLLPQLPTVAEAGLPGYESGSWYGALLPAKTPATIVETLNREMVKAIKAPDVRERLTADGAEVVGSSPTEFAKFLRTDLDRWRRLAASLKL